MAQAGQSDTVSRCYWLSLPSSLWTRSTNSQIKINTGIFSHGFIRIISTRMLLGLVWRKERVPAPEPKGLPISRCLGQILQKHLYESSLSNQLRHVSSCWASKNLHGAVIYLWNKTECRLSWGLGTTQPSFPHHSLGHPTATHTSTHPWKTSNSLMIWRLFFFFFWPKLFSLGIFPYSTLRLPNLSYFSKYSFYPTLLPNRWLKENLFQRLLRLV